LIFAHFISTRRHTIYKSTPGVVEAFRIPSRHDNKPPQSFLLTFTVKMKSAVAAMGLFAVMANAYQHPRHFHFRRDNTTAEAGMTTLTVIATQVETVISCAPTVTSCPSKQTDIAALPESEKSTVVVTNTLVLTETVCPISDVPAISSSVISEASQGIITGSTLTSSLAPSVPLSTAPGVPIATTTTGDASPGEPTEPANPSVTTTEFVTTKSLTMTLGTGTDTSVVTSTYTTTVVATVTCDGGCGGNSGGNGENGSTEEPKPTEEPTTTTTATSTGTTTVTVPKPSATEDGVPGNGNNGGDKPEGEGEGEGECKPTATVTVTAQASTVYVTVTPEASKTQTEAEAAPSVTGVEEEEEEEEEEEDACVDSTTTLQTTVTVQPTGKPSATAPFPIGNNGTTSGVAAPTGFAHLRY
jgi:hypothetical protein